MSPDKPPAADWALIRKRIANRIPLESLAHVARHFVPVADSRKFILLAERSLAIDRIHPCEYFDIYIQPLADHIEPIEAEPLHIVPDSSRRRDEGGAHRVAVFLTTYNRPRALARSLPSIAALGEPVLVVDDGSEPEIAEINRQIATTHAASYIGLGNNRGVAAAINIGVSYWLADPRIEWISYFQDDVEVSPETLRLLSRFEDLYTTPIMTGFDSSEFEAEKSEILGGVPVKYKLNSTAMHLHAHRAYWSAVSPIPTKFLGAPKPDLGSASEDTWIIQTAPASIVRRGGYILCVPGLVKHFAWRRADSTWANQFPLEAATECQPGD